MRKNRAASGLLLLAAVLCLAGCGKEETAQMSADGQNEENLIPEGNMET